MPRAISTQLFWRKALAGPLLLEAGSAARSQEAISASLDKAAEVCGSLERILEEVKP
ncbi:MAG: hypothetical protein O7E51_14850 [Acidobacteria bacterium]|nr:hypothetical protein [Acidobacteriota bacterium]